MIHLPASCLYFQLIELHKRLVNTSIDHFIGSIFQKRLQTSNVFSFSFSCSCHATAQRVTDGQEHRNWSLGEPSVCLVTNSSSEHLFVCS